jgi:hypothetical protein
MQRDEFLGSAGCQPAVVGSLPTTYFVKAKAVESVLKLFGKLPKRTGWQPVLPSKDARLCFPEAHGANQSPPLKPAQPKDAKQAASDCRRLGNDRARYQDIIDDILEICTI